MVVVELHKMVTELRSWHFPKYFQLLYQRLKKYKFADTCQVTCFKISHYASQLDVKLKIYGNFLSVSASTKFNNFEKKKWLTNASQFLLLLLYLIHFNKFWTILPCMLHLWTFSPWKVDQLVTELHNF